MGLSQKLFLKSFPPFWKSSKASLLEALYQKELIQRIDFEAAQFLTEGIEVEGASLVFAYLFSATRLGHLCVRISPCLEPKLSQIWLSEEHALNEIEENELNRAIQKALKDIPLSFFEKHPQIVLEENNLYIHKNWLYEREVWDLFQKYAQDKPALDCVNIVLDTLLLEEQKNAVISSLKHCISFITGGPGVGKTFTASHLIHCFISNFPSARVAILAPTGKAVANLQGQFLQFLEKKKSQVMVDVFTLHKLFSQNIYSFLPYDLILVDESSMIDLVFMRKLLQAVKPHSRLVFLGDPNQLPPIESGFIFKDFISTNTHVSHLVTCLRTDRIELVSIAQAVNEGNEEFFIETISSKQLIHPLDYLKRKEFYSFILPLIPNVSKDMPPYDMLKSFQVFKILSPLRKGVFGVDLINSELEKLLGKQAIQPIMITSNDYRMELFNGDSGILVEGEHALFFSRTHKESYYNSELNIRKIPRELLPTFELSYAISVHKSQGSEYDSVAILLPHSSETFGKEMLYTAITRAKKHFDIFGDLSTLKKILKTSATRYSGFQANRGSI
ncbi:MAG: RecBCD enzyme subunit RecD [Chlamydiae bacterium]|nr:RecBCD enzyme subunit RecD [Chlamydiota bacterium]